MRAPLTFAWRNVLFGAGGAGDAWALFRLSLQAYPGRTLTGKLELLSAVAAWAVAVEADFQILRVSRAWSPDEYRAAARAGLDPAHGREERLERLVEQHVTTVGGRPGRPDVFVCVRLATPSMGWLARARRAVGLDAAPGISQRLMDGLLAAEAAAFGRLTDYLDAERATTREVQWLIARTMRRGVGEPFLDPEWAPQAIVLDTDDEDGGRRLVPFGADILRLLDTPVDIERDHVRIAGARQAVLVAGAMPETTVFPGRQAELLFAPLEALEFPVDACLHARWIANDRALALVRRKVVDADHAYREEAMGDHGPTSNTATRPDLVRELEQQLTAADRPPLLRAQLSYLIAADDADELEERARRVRRELAPIALHRPRDVQFDLWSSHLPAQAAALRRYDDVLLPEQVGAMVPTATHAVGADRGLIIGHTLSGSRQPVLFDITEGSRTSRAPAVLVTGTLGSGKTMSAQLLALHAVLRGSRVVDLDPKGDHRMADVLAPELVETIELTADGHRGMLDPLRIAPADLKVELAHSFLCELLPAPVPANWQTEIRAAVAAAVAAGGHCLDHAIDVLDQGADDAREAGRAIGVHAASGLLQLGFGDSSDPVATAGDRALTSLRIANLTLPAPGTDAADLTPDERTGRALLRLLTVHALQVAASDWTRHKVLIIEELSQLIADQVGLSLVERVVRLCRSQNATPILVTQTVEDADRLADLIGCYLAFGTETDAQAGRVLRLLGLDADDDEQRTRLRSFRRGRCLMRDYDGRISPVQIDLMDPELLAALDTTPTRASARA